MATLHILNKSGTSSPSLHSVARLMKRRDGLLLIENAVYIARKNGPDSDLMISLLTEHGVYVLLPDLQARGVSAEDILSEVTPVDYRGFVDLSAEYEKPMSWF